MGRPLSSSGAKPLNLALQGGGSHGAITWGVLDRLLEEDTIAVDSISGASAGAVNAVALAYGLYLDGNKGARETLNTLWRTISEVGAIYSPVRQTPFEQFWQGFNLDDSITYRMFDNFTRTLSPYQFNPFNIDPLRDILSKCIDFERLKSCANIRLYLSATNVRTGKVQVFTTADVSVDVISASTCLPFLFKAVEINGEHYWDGGYMGNPVLYPFFYESDANDVLIVHVNPLERGDIPTSAPEIANRVNEISFNSSLLRELRAISFVHKLLDDGWIKDEYRDHLTNVRIHSIRSDASLTDLSVASKFNVDWQFLTNLKQRGRDVADQWLTENYQHIGTRSSVDLREMFSG